MTGTPLCLLLLPSALEDFEGADVARDLLRAPAVVAAEPARLSRVPEALGEALAAIQARRLLRKLPGRPHAVVAFDAGQYPLARAVLGRVEECELWYGGGHAERDDVLHDLALQRAALTFEFSGDEPAFRRNAPLWDRLEELGIARR